MDRALKERTIGAVVLVVFAVIVVPVFLDGPADDAAVTTEPVVLPGQEGQPRRRQTIVLERDREEPVPVAAPAAEPERVAVAVNEPDPEPAAAEPRVEKSTAAVAKAEEEPVKEPPADKPTAAPPPAPASESGLWAVQLGSFSNRDNAEKLAAGLRADGYAAFLSKLNTASGELHRVRIGPQKDRDAAEGVARTLASAGHTGQVVPHP
jgi:DedD protein